MYFQIMSITITASWNVFQVKRKKGCAICATFTSLIRIELTHPPPEGGALSTELQGLFKYIIAITKKQGLREKKESYII